MGTTSLSNSGATAVVYFQLDNTQPVAGIISLRTFGLFTPATTRGILQLYKLSNTISGALTAEKLNTRSPTPLTRYFGTASGNSHNLIFCSMSQFNPSSWVAHPRYIPLTTDFNTENLTLVGDNNSVQATFDEDALARKPQSRPRMRRTRKPGYWNLMGNVINRVATSGGGSFNAIYPQFQNDLTWQDYSAWQNLHPQAWNINTQGTVVTAQTPQRMLVGMGI